MDGAVRAVWTDFGGVLTPPVAETMRDFGLRVGVTPEALGEAMAEVGRSHGTDSMAPLDTPLVSEVEWSRQVERVLRDRFKTNVDLSGFADKWFAGRPANGAWVAELRRLRAEGWFVGLLSNMVPSWDAHWRAMVPAEEVFDDVVCSYEVGCRKPEPEIFALAARRAGVPPEACVLVDDLEVNCAGARAAGWQAVFFTSAEDAAARVAAMLEPAGITP